MAVSNISPNVDNYYLGKGVVSWKGTNDTAYRDVGNVSKFEVTPSVTKLEHYSSRSGIKVLDKQIVNQQLMKFSMDMDEWTADNLALAMMATADTTPINLTNVAGTTTSAMKTLTGIAPTTGLVIGRRYNISGTGIAAGSTFTYDSAGTGTLSLAATASGAQTDLAITGAIALDMFTESQLTGSVKFVGANDVGAHITIELPNVIITPAGALAVIGDNFGEISVEGDVYVNPDGNFGTVYWNVPAGSEV